MNSQLGRKTKSKKNESGKGINNLLSSDVIFDMGFREHTTKCVEEQIRDKARLHLLEVLNAYKSNQSLLNFGKHANLKFRPPQKTIVSGQPSMKRYDRSSAGAGKWSSHSSSSLLQDGYLLRATKKYINILTKDHGRIVPQRFASHRRAEKMKSTSSHHGKRSMKVRDVFYDVESMNSS